MSDNAPKYRMVLHLTDDAGVEIEYATGCSNDITRALCRMINAVETQAWDAKRRVTHLEQSITEIARQLAETAAKEKGEGMSEKAGQINQYTCRDCGHVITTVNAHDGTTPMFLGCRSPDGCTGLMASDWYRVPEGAIPDFVWYKPDEDQQSELDTGTLQHVKKGGLLLRPREE